MTNPSQASNSANAQVINLQISNVSTPEGLEPAYIGPKGKGAADIFTVKVGTEVEVVVKNSDAMPHTFTVPQLGINISIAPMTTTKFNFTAKTSGTYSWYCAVPCGSWVMSHVGYMKGYFKVT
jgi:heme/copper-type cytochrome/quinol oxidase subunit 2